MGLLNKIKENVRINSEKKSDGKKSEMINDASNQDTKKIEIKNSQNIQKEQLQNELTVVRREISEKTDHLTSIVEKLELSKKEYEDVISKVMHAKSEFAENKNYVNEIQEAKKELSHITEKIDVRNSELNKLDVRKNEMEPKLLESNKEMQKIDLELNQKNKELDIVKKQLNELRTQKKKESGDDSKKIVESASQVVSSMNKRLQDTLNELELVRQLLEKEKAEHNELKKKFQG